jgi:hypothetical protein
MARSGPFKSSFLCSPARPVYLPVQYFEAAEGEISSVRTPSPRSLPSRLGTMIREKMPTIPWSWLMRSSHG